jgi:hypothetical protein
VTEHKGTWVRGPREGEAEGAERMSTSYSLRHAPEKVRYEFGVYSSEIKGISNEVKDLLRTPN